MQAASQFNVNVDANADTLAGMEEFIIRHRLPVFDFLGETTRLALGVYLMEGNRAFKAKRLLEFFRSLDWLPYEDIPHNPLTRFPAGIQQQIRHDIQNYLDNRQKKREHDAQARKDRHLRVIEYYRAKVPPSDKALLESLRDYELALTARDTNWQHYFALRSFKRIDDFIALSVEARQKLMDQFKQDIQTYRKNREKLKQAGQFPYEQTTFFSFDDWCDQQETFWKDQDAKQSQRQASYSQQQQSSQQHSDQYNRVTVLTPALQAAYSTMEVRPGTDWSEVRKQFRRLTLNYHPDLPGGDTEQMKRIIAAYEQLRAHFKQA